MNRRRVSRALQANVNVPSSEIDWFLFHCGPRSTLRPVSLEGGIHGEGNVSARAPLVSPLAADGCKGKKLLVAAVKN